MASARSRPLRYRRIAELGKGGMATVYVTAQEGTSGFERLVVVKEMRPDLADRDEFKRMFFEEARVAARLRHPNVVETYDVIEDSPGVYSIVMEFLDGQPLSRLRAAARREVLVPLQLYILSEALSGLDHVHAHGLIHRDISPQNVCITYDGGVKILDFGIAKARDTSLQTSVGVLKGKLAYMAPEQAVGKGMDHRTDLFSVGVLLWEALVGRRLWHGVPETAIITRLLAGQIPHVREAKPDVPEELDAICARALAVDPQGRYDSANDFKKDLDAFIATMSSHPTRQELAELMVSLFSEQRRALHEQITAARTSAPPGLLPVELPKIHLTAPASATSTSSIGSRPRSRPSALTHPTTKRASFFLGAIAGAAVLGAGIGLVVHLTRAARRDASTSVAPDAPVTSATHAPASPAASAPAVVGASTGPGTTPSDVPVASPGPPSAKPLEPQPQPRRTFVAPAPPTHAAPSATPSASAPARRPDEPPDLGY